MKKIALALTVASVFTSSVFAGEYGFRDFLVDQKTNFMSIDEKTTILTSNLLNNIGTYCAIEGGNIETTIRTELGTSSIKLYTDDVISKLQSMSKDDRIAKYGSRYNRNFNREFTNDKMPYMGDKFECKLPSGQVAFSALRRTSAWIVEHDKEPMEDRVSYSVFSGNMYGTPHIFREGRSTEIKKTLNFEYPTYYRLISKWLIELNRPENIKYNNNYSFYHTFTFGYTANLEGMMNELQEIQYFCEAKHGDFLKDGKPFREFIKDFYLSNSSVNRDTFKGTYVCANTPEAFTLTLDEYIDDRDNFYTMDDAVFRKVDLSAEQNITRKSTAQKGMENIKNYVGSRDFTK
jgi:hypothetical protein